MEAKVKAGNLRKWNALLYSIALQWKLDIRSRSLLVTCYIVPLMFFLLMGSLFTSVMPEMKETLIFLDDRYGRIYGRLDWFAALTG